MQLKEHIDNKNKYEKFIVDLLNTYSIKYLKKVFLYLENEKNIFKKFQLKLIKIAEWNTEKQNKEYKKFIKWCAAKKNIDEHTLKHIFHNYLTLSIQIIAYNNITPENFPKYIYPNLDKVFYKCLKSISRWFYENPKQIQETLDTKLETLKKILKIEIQKMLPLKQILNILQTKQEDPIFVDYDFNKSESTEEQLIDSDMVELLDNCKKKFSLTTKVVIEKENNNEPNYFIQQNENTLNYIDSENMENDFDKSSHHSENNLENENELKYVNIPIQNKKT